VIRSWLLELCADILRSERLTLALDLMVPFAHWITPEPMRIALRLLRTGLMRLPMVWPARPKNSSASTKPTRNATVPAPPLSPVVSRSTKSVRDPSPSGGRNVGSSSFSVSPSGTSQSPTRRVP